MKITKQCGECGGREIYVTLSRVDSINGVLPFIGSLLMGPQIEIYICGRCGHHQIFVPESELARAKEHYILYSQDSSLVDENINDYPEL